MTPIKVDALFPFSDKLPTPTPLHSAGLAWPGWNGGMHTNNNNTSSVHPSLRRRWGEGRRDANYPEEW